MGLRIYLEIKLQNFNFTFAVCAAAVLLGLYSFALPACKPTKINFKDSFLVEVLGLNAFKLLETIKWLFLQYSLCFAGVYS